jgi:hypothetical protein
MSLFALVLAVHAIAAVLGVGLLGAIPVTAAFVRRRGAAVVDESDLIATLLRYTLWSLVIVGLSGVLLEVAARGAFHSALWFQGSVALYLVLGFLHGRARRALRKGLRAGADPGARLASLQSVERWGWAMCAAASAIALLMVVKPFA